MNPYHHDAQLDGRKTRTMSLREKLEARLAVARAKLWGLPKTGHDIWCECDGCCAAERRLEAAEADCHAIEILLGRAGRCSDR